jgi:hypothetical protein
MHNAIALRRTYVHVTVYTFLLLSVGVTVAADNPKPSDARVTLEPRVIGRELTERSDNIRVDSNLVLIPVTVTDRHSRLVTGLDKEYFKIFEDKVEQTIIHFGMDDAPVSVGVVLDCSGSMSDKLGTGA